MIAQSPTKILSVVSQLVIPLKKDLSTRDPEISYSSLRRSSRTTCSPPRLQELFFANIHLGNRIEYGQRKKLNFADLIVETLEQMDGGRT
jgi:hypothetical protein